MIPLAILAAVAVVVALALGGDWERVALGGLFVLLVVAMLETMPLRDWLYPTDGERPRDD